MSAGRGVRASIATSTVVAASPSEVFKYLTNRKYHYLWNPQIYSISPMGPLKLGSKYETESLVLGVSIKSSNIVTKFVPPKEFELENKLGIVQYRTNFRLNLKADKTVVVCSTTLFTEHKAFAFSVPIFKRLAKRELQTDMQALKIAVKSQLQ